MARNVVIQVTCDICGTDVSGTEGLQFSVGGNTYEVDLCDVHRREFNDAVNRFVEVGHAVARGGSATARPGAVRRPGAPVRRDREQLNAIREWARGQGYDVRERGRIPAHIEEAYNNRR